MLSHFSPAWLFATIWRPASLLYPWDSPGKNIRVGSHALQGILQTQGLNLHLL